MSFNRILHLPQLLEKKSFFLFGSRSTGKSYLIREQLGNALVLDLLRTELYFRLSNRPSELEALIEGASQRANVVVIDEVQKIPQLLDEVHRLIEEKNIIFLLTGSSARKLKRGQANLLAGRAWTAYLFPLCWPEIKNFDLNRYLRYGGLPNVYQNPFPEEELDAYVQTFLKEEILVEGLIRKLPPFSRFLKAAALSTGQPLNLTQIASDCQVPASTVREHYSILEDTLVGFFLEPWTRSQKRKAAQTAKFYFFDPGVTHTLTGTKTLDRNSNLYGASFEQFIGMELRAYLSYRRIKEPLSFWRSLHGYEVDFVVGDHTAIEVKDTQRVSQYDMKGLKALKEEAVFKEYYLISQDPIEMKKDGVTVIYWENFLKKLWEDQLFV
ncbi:MAG: ATP-binding protein [Chlamydiae bacterium]|nr:ATP-binding protein [Chlamydiota bacterium]MBI3278007.1 ATP-binding protein [Chlamydiota bacterium]